MPADTLQTQLPDSLARIEREATERYYQDGPPANLDLKTWRLNVELPDGSPTSFTYGDLQGLPQVTQDRRFVCVCAWSVRQTWSGVLLRDVLKAAGHRPLAAGPHELYVRQESIGSLSKPYHASISLRDAVLRDTLLCLSIDGQPLSLARGFPLRLYDFALYGYKCVKGLANLTVTSELERGWWETERNYPEDGTIRPKRYSIFDLGESRLLKRRGEVTEF